MFSVRLIVAFQKTEHVRHIGHLDIQRAVQRAIRRGNVPVRYSEGFHPHAVLSFASPLAVGVSGAFELMDIALEAECDPNKAFEKLKRSMPPALPVFLFKAVSDSEPKLMAMLKMADYLATFETSPEALQLADAIDSFLCQKEVVALRKTKSGENPCDIRPMVHALHAACGEQQITVDCRVSLMEKETLKPDLLLESLARHAGVALPSYRLCRLRLLTEKDEQTINLMER